MVADAKPRAKPGLLATDHSKRGQRYVTVLEEEAGRVTLLAPWEHAVLVLCDGTRTAPDIVALLADGVDGEPVTREGVLRCLVSFSRDGLIDSVPEAPTPAARPATLANIQQAYREWHKDPDRSGRLLSGLLSPPFFDDPPPFQPSLAPTVALPPNDEGPPPVAVGSTLVVGGEASHEDRLLRSVLNGDGPTGGALAPDEDLTNVAELLAAVDVELASEAELTEADCAPEWPTEANGAPAGPASPINGVGRAVGGVADLPGARASVPGTDGAAGDGVMTPPKRFAHRKLSEAALTPTMVGVPPPEGAGPPVIVSPPRVDGKPSDSGIKQPGTGPRSAGHRVLATVGPVPSAPDIPASSPPAPAEASEAPPPSSPKNKAAAASTEPPPSGADTIEASSPSTAAE